MIQLGRVVRQQSDGGSLGRPLDEGELLEGLIEVAKAAAQSVRFVLQSERYNVADTVQGLS